MEFAPRFSKPCLADAVATASFLPLVRLVAFDAALVTLLAVPGGRPRALLAVDDVLAVELTGSRSGSDSYANNPEKLPAALARGAIMHSL